jgi:hypothetical protein
MSTHTRDFVDACILRCNVETTGPMGGDAGHGGRTTVRLESVSSVCMGAELEFAVHGGVQAVEVTVYGDAELSTLRRALRWAADVLGAEDGLDRPEEQP